MGYQKITDFSDSAVDLSHVSDWPPFIGDKPRTVFLDFREKFKIQIPLTQNIFIKEKDPGDSWHEFSELRLTCRTITNAILLQNHPRHMKLIMRVLCDKEVLAEWYIPLRNAHDYQCYDQDLTHAFKDGETYFDTIEFESLDELNMQVYLDELWLFQNNITHNISLTLTELFHKKVKKYLTTTITHAKPGDLTLQLSSVSEIRKGTPLLIGKELHIVSNDPLNSNKSVSFTEIFDGENIRESYSGGTPVYICIPAWYKDFSQVDQTFPSFYIKATIPNQDFTQSITNVRKDSYRIINGKAEVAVRKSVDVIKIVVEIHILAYNDVIAEEMQSYLRSKIDDQGFLNICGESAEYEIDYFNVIDSDADTDTTEPHSVMQITVSCRDNVHSRKYVNFPAIQSIAIDIDSVTELQK